MKRSKFDRSIPGIVVFLIAGYVGLFSWVAYIKFTSFSFYDIDLAVINQIFWNTVRGNIITDQIGSATILNGGHVFLIAIILAPIYFLAQSPVTLLFLQSIALGLGGWAIYLIARDLISPSGGLILAFCYLIYPALNYVNLFEFHPIAFSTPLLLFMFFFYQRKKWGLFLLFMLLALSCREDVSIPVFGFGVFGMIQLWRKPHGMRRKELKWTLVPLLAGLIWILFCVKFLQPYFRLPELQSAGGGGITAGYYGWLGSSPWEILQNVFTDPKFGLLTEPKLLYLLHLFIPLAFVSLLSPSAMVMVLITLTEGLLSSRFTHYSIRYQYSSIITPFVFVAAIYGLRNLFSLKFMTRKKWYVLALVLICSVVSARMIGPLFKLASGGVRQWQVTEEDKIRQYLVDKIPPRAPTISTFEFTPKLSMRPQLFYFYAVYTDSRRGPDFSLEVQTAQKDSEWALIDFNDYLTFYDFYTPGGDRDTFRFLDGGNWQLVESVNSLALFKKGERPELALAGRASESEINDRMDIRIAPFAKLIGLDVKPKKFREAKITQVEAFFVCLSKIPDDWLFFVVFSRRGDPGFQLRNFFWAAYRMYPTSRWSPGEIVKQTCDILIPEDIPGGDYDLILGFLQSKHDAPTGAYNVALAMSVLPARFGIDPRRTIDQKIIFQKKNVLSIRK